jgi:hypothetical protein
MVTVTSLLAQWANVSQVHLNKKTGAPYVCFYQIGAEDAGLGGENEKGAGNQPPAAFYVYW